MNILEAIYEGYIMKTGYLPKKRTAEKQFGEVWEKAEKALGEEFGEELRGKIFDYMNDECSQEFQAGFRIGALLMAELYFAAPAGTEL